MGFDKMKNELRIFSFWSIDDLTDLELVKKQLYNMKSLGFNGVVFHPRRYSGKPAYLSDEYMSAVNSVILYAKSIEMQFWLYDENGWPSGSANGQVLRDIPDLMCKWLECENGKVVIKERAGINSLDARGVSHFIELTHEAYKKKLDNEAFEWVGGFFSDEVGFLEGHGACMDRGGIPWADSIAKAFQDTFDREIYGELPKLFEEEQDDFKAWYWEAVTELLSTTFYGLIEKWCSDNNKLFTAHLKGEENPFFQIGYSGSCFQILKAISVPGIDVLERYAGNSYYLHIASSISKQFGSGIAMAEAMGGAGWGLTPGDVKRYTQKLIDCGINMFVFHINQLHLNYGGITDWPSSIPCHQPWCGAFVQLTNDMKKRAAELKPVDTLLVVPVRGTMKNFAPSLVRGMNEHDGSQQMISKASVISKGAVSAGERLYSEGISFDVTDEKVFENCADCQNRTIRLGNCEYSRVVTVKGCEFSERGTDLLNQIGAVTFSELFADGIRQTDWQIIPPSENRYFVELKAGQGVIDVEYLCDCRLLVSDLCEVKLNGKKLCSTANDEYGFYYPLSKTELFKGRNTVELSTDNAFVYVLGCFAVKNDKPFFEVDARQLRTANGFYIAQPAECGTDFISSGYPFSANPIKLIKQLEGNTSGRIRIGCEHIAAAHVYVDGEDYGWIYEGSDTIQLSSKSKKCELVLEVYQSAYNIYGPHHHLEGDRPLVSPAQFEGKKNFADTPSLPENTLEDDMKFIKWSISENIEIIRE